MWRYSPRSLDLAFQDDAKNQRIDPAANMRCYSTGDWIKSGDLRKTANMYWEAIQDYSKAIQLDPVCATAWTKKGHVLILIHEYKEALRYFNKAIGLDPEDAGAWFGKGIALDLLDKYEDAISSYSEAARHDPENFRAWNRMGNVYCKLGKYEEAAFAYEVVTQLNPENHVGWYNRGSASVKLGRKKEAWHFYEDAYRRWSPKNIKDSERRKRLGIALGKPATVIGRQVIGITYSKIYHSPDWWCANYIIIWIEGNAVKKMIDFKDQIAFADSHEAEANEYAPCPLCRPR